MSGYELSQEMRAAEELKTSLEAAFPDDPELVADMIEGETDLDCLMITAMNSLDDDQTLIDGIKIRTDELNSRKSRIEKRRDVKRSIVEQALLISGRQKIECPTFTISIGKQPRSTVITDESEVPVEFWKPQDPKLDKKALNKALKALKPGESIPGAMLSNGGIQFRLGRK